MPQPVSTPKTGNRYGNEIGLIRGEPNQRAYPWSAGSQGKKKQRQHAARRRRDSAQGTTRRGGIL